MMAWIWLALAISGEIVGTLSLKPSDGFSRPAFGALSVVSYAIAFFCLAQVLKTIPVGIAYAIWAGVGVAAVSVMGVVLFGQRLDWPAVIGITLIVAGVIVLNVFSQTSAH